MFSDVVDVGVSQAVTLLVCPRAGSADLEELAVLDLDCLRSGPRPGVSGDVPVFRIRVPGLDGPRASCASRGPPGSGNDGGVSGRGRILVGGTREKLGGASRVAGGYRCGRVSRVTSWYRCERCRVRRLRVSCGCCLIGSFLLLDALEIVRAGGMHYKKDADDDQGAHACDNTVCAGCERHMVDSTASAPAHCPEEEKHCHSPSLASVVFRCPVWTLRHTYTFNVHVCRRI